MSFGTTPLSTTVLGANQFPVSGVYPPNTAGGNIIALQGGPASSADSNGNISAPVATYNYDGNDQTLGATTDLSSANTLIGLTKAIKANTASPIISGTVTANQGGSWTVTANAGSGSFTVAQATGTNLHTVVDSGTVTANQGGTWNLNNISGTISLPTGAATAAKQPAFGTAGSASSDVLTVQGIASMTPLKVDASVATVTVTASNLQTNLNQVGAASITLGSKTSANSLPVVIASDQAAVPASQSGSWTVTANAGSGTFAVSGTITANAGTGTFNNQQTNVTADYDSGVGTQSLTMFGLALPASGGAVAGGTASNPVRIDPTGSTTQPVSGTVTANQGGTWTVQPGNTPNTSPWLMTIAQGGNSATVTSLTNSKALAVEVVDGSGNQITSFGGSNASVSATGSAVPASGTYIAGNKSGNLVGLSLDTSGNLNVNVAAGGGSGGTSSSFGSAFPATGTAAGYSDGTNMQGPRVFDADTGGGTQYVLGANLRISGSGGSIEAKGQQTMANSLPVVIASDQSAVPVSGTVTANAGSGTFNIQANASVNIAQVAGGATSNAGQTGALQVGGAVATNTVVSSATNPLLIAGSDYGGTPKVQSLKVDSSGNAQVAITNTPTVTANAGSGTFTISGTVTANAGTNLNTSLLALESGGNLATLAGGVSSSKYQANVAQFGGSNVATGTGAGGAGIPRVTASNDSEIQLWDGTTGPVAVKAASTSPALLDKALVTAISPNNTGLPVNVPTVVQKRSSSSSGSVASLALAFSSNNLAGNSIIVVCGVGNGTSPTISDTASNTYTKATQIANGTALNVAVFFAVNVAAGGNTVTVNNGGTTASIAMEIYEVSGLLTLIAAQPDQIATNTGSSGTASTSVVSPMSCNELAFVAVGIGTAAQTITAGSGWTNDSGQLNPTTPAGLFSFVSLSQFLEDVGAVTPTATFTSEPWAIACATFTPVVLGVQGSMKLTDGTVTMAFGQQTMANSVPVAIASNQSNVPANIAQFGGNNVATGTGAGGAGIPRVTVSNDSTVGSNSATGSSVPANAFYGGGLAKTALPTATSDGQLTGEMTDKFGRQVVLPNAMRDLVGSATLTLSASTSETTLIGQTASVFHDLTAVIVNNTSGTAARIDFRDTTGGSVIFAIYVPAGDVRGVTFQTPQPQTTVNTNWSAQSSASVTDIRIFAQYISNR